MTNVIPFRPRVLRPPVVPAGELPAPRGIGSRHSSPINFRRISDAQLQADILILRRQVQSCPSNALSRSLLDQYEQEAAWRRQGEPA